MKTVFPSKGEITRSWVVLDASTAPLGRLASEAARILMGKNKPIFTPFLDTGDHVIIINAEKVVLTGNKADELIYWHSGWPNGLKNISRGKMLADDPVKLVEKAVWGMTPKTKLGKALFKKLKVYAGSEHPHQAQNPEPLNIKKDKN